VSHIQDIRPSTVYSSDDVMQICASFSIGGLGLSVETYQALPLALAHFCTFPHGASSNHMLTNSRLIIERQSCSQRSTQTYALSRKDFSPITQELEGFLHNVVNMGFLDRLKLAWKIIFPVSTIKENSNANIAKQRLKMILFSDRCEVSDEAKKKIVENVIEVLSEFVG